MATSINEINLKFPIVHEQIQSIQNSTHRRILASTEAALRPNQSFLAWSDPLGSRKCPHEVWWSHAQSKEKNNHFSSHFRLNSPPCMCLRKPNLNISNECQNHKRLIINHLLFYVQIFSLNTHQRKNAQEIHH